MTISDMRVHAVNIAADNAGAAALAFYDSAPLYDEIIGIEPKAKVNDTIQEDD